MDLLSKSKVSEVPAGGGGVFVVEGRSLRGRIKLETAAAHSVRILDVFPAHSEMLGNIDKTGIAPHI